VKIVSFKKRWHPRKWKWARLKNGTTGRGEMRVANSEVGGWGGGEMKGLGGASQLEKRTWKWSKRGVRNVAYGKAKNKTVRNGRLHVGDKTIKKARWRVYSKKGGSEGGGRC